MKKIFIQLVFLTGLSTSALSQKVLMNFNDTISYYYEKGRDTTYKRPVFNKSTETELSLRKLLGLYSDLTVNSNSVYSQNCLPDTALIRGFLSTLPYLNQSNEAGGQKSKFDKLVSFYAFRKLIKKDFNTIVLGNGEVSKLTRYASLDLSKKPAFAFSPFIWESDVESNPYKNIVSVNISGKLNQENFYDLSKVRDLTLNLSWTHILNLTNYKSKERANVIRTSDGCDLINQTNKFVSGYWKNFENICLNPCKDPDVKKKSGVLRKQFYKDYADFQLEKMEPYWSSKNFWWFSIEGEVTRDKVDYIPAIDTIGGKFEVKNETIFTPSVLGTFNYFTQETENENSFFVKVWGSLKKKHSLSEILEPEKFQSFHRQNDSLHLFKESKDVFVTDFTSLTKKTVFDFGIRAVTLLDISKITPGNDKQAGISFSFSRMGLVNNKDFASLFRTEVGAIFPFKNADDKTTFNLEIFRRWDTFSNFDNKNEKLWGVRFNVPIN